MKDSKRLDVYTITVTVTAKVNGAAENLTNFSAELERGNNPAERYAVSDSLKANKDGVVVFKSNVDFIGAEKLYIRLMVPGDHYAVDSVQDIGRPQKDLDVCFVILPQVQTARQKRTKA
jgi:hypothetical protein